MIAKKILVAIIKFYRNSLSCFKLPTCRYIPTCSEYAIESIEEHGIWKGGAKAVARILHCHPWGGSGYDPVKKGCK